MSDTLPLLQAAPLFPVPVTRRQLYQWVYVGVLDKRGNRVKLRTIQIGGTRGRRYVTREQVEAFVEAVSEPAPQVAPKPTRREEAERRKRIEDAIKFLHTPIR